MLFDSSLRKVTAEGSEDFVVSMAQQICWLCAACHQKPDRLSYAYVGFANRDSVFQVDTRLEAATDLAPESCWYPLVGPANIICGFPFPERQNGERGLEISVSAMAAMAGIPQAVSFRGGFIFKGRSHALVPVERLGESVQWHTLDTYPAKLDWTQVEKACPTRLKGYMEDIADRRTFVGWFSDVLELLGM